MVSGTVQLSKGCVKVGWMLEPYCPVVGVMRQRTVIGKPSGGSVCGGLCPALGTVCFHILFHERCYVVFAAFPCTADSIVDVFGVLVLGREAHRHQAACSSINIVYCMFRFVRNVGVRFSVPYPMWYYDIYLGYYYSLLTKQHSHIIGVARLQPFPQGFVSYSGGGGKRAQMVGRIRSERGSILL